MNKSDILAAAKGKIIKPRFMYTISISNGVPTLLDKCHFSGNDDLILEEVLTKADIEFAQSDEYKSFLDKIRSEPCGKPVRERKNI